MSEGKRFTRKKSIKNWREYNEGLKKLYDITAHVNPEVLKKPATRPADHQALVSVVHREPNSPQYGRRR